MNFTLFEKTGKPPRLSPREQRDATEIDIGGATVSKHRFGQTDAFRWTTSGTHFMLLGEIPTPEMQKVVESIIDKANVK